MKRRLEESLMFIQGEYSERPTLGEHTRAMLHEVESQQAFFDRRQSGSVRSLASSPGPSSSASRPGTSSPCPPPPLLPELGPKASSPPHRLGRSFKETRPLIVSSSHGNLTSASMISFSGAGAGGHPRPQTPTITPGLWTPLRSSKTSGSSRARMMPTTDVVDARFPGQTWGVYNTAPYRPSLRAALEAMHTDDMRWVHGAWRPRGGNSTPRSERVARMR